MNVVTAVLRIKRQFGDEYNIIITNDDIYGWIYEAEMDIIRATGCNDNVVNTTVGAFPVNVPDSVSIKRVSIDGKALIPTSKEELDLLGLSDTVPDTPGYWYREKTQVHLWPQTVPSTQAIRIEYNKTPTLMTGDPTANTFTVPEVWHPDLLRFCIARAHNKNQRTDLERVEMDTYDRNVGKRHDEANNIDAPIYKLPDPLDYDIYG